MYNQKPDRSLPIIRAALDENQIPYKLVPMGFGCDILTKRPGPGGHVTAIFMEVKNPEDETRDAEKLDKLLTPREKALRAFCRYTGLEYQIVFTPEQALSVCGWGVAE